MVTGYVAQTVLFNDMPKHLKLFGAACMLASTIIMAVRCQAEQTDGMESGGSLGSFAAFEVQLHLPTSPFHHLRTPPEEDRKDRACLPVLALSQMSS